MGTGFNDAPGSYGAGGLSESPSDARKRDIAIDAAEIVLMKKQVEATCPAAVRMSTGSVLSQYSWKLISGHFFINVNVHSARSGHLDSYLRSR